MLVIPATWESKNSRISVQACLGIKQEPISKEKKITNAKWAVRVFQVVVCLPRKHEALNLTPYIAKDFLKKRISAECILECHLK
jgi:hypothetical protein